MKTTNNALAVAFLSLICGLVWTSDAASLPTAPKLSPGAQVCLDAAMGRIAANREAYDAANRKAVDEAVQGLKREIEKALAAKNLDLANMLNAKVKEVQGADFILGVEDSLNKGDLLGSKPIGRIAIVSAVYGIEGKEMDVADRLRKMIDKRTNSLVMPITYTTFGDPAPGLRKRLVLVYNTGGDNVTVTINDTEVLSINPPRKNK